MRDWGTGKIPYYTLPPTNEQKLLNTDQMEITGDINNRQILNSELGVDFMEELENCEKDVFNNLDLTKNPQNLFKGIAVQTKEKDTANQDIDLSILGIKR